MARPCRPSWAPACSQTAQSVSPSSISSRTRDIGARSARKRLTEARSSSCSALTPRIIGCSLASVMTRTSSASTWSPFTHSGLTSSARSDAVQRERGLAQTGDGLGHRVQVGGRRAARAVQQRQPAQLAEHPPDLGGVHREQAQAGVAQDLDPDPAQAHRQHRAERGIDGDAGQQLGAAGAHRRDQHAVDAGLRHGHRRPRAPSRSRPAPPPRNRGRAPPRRCRTCG